jgi:hypothetical protein
MINLFLSIEMAGKIQDVRFMAHGMPTSMSVIGIWGTLNKYCPVFVA